MVTTVVLWTTVMHSERTEMREEGRRGLDASKSCCKSRRLAYGDDGVDNFVGLARAAAD
jgi:hypothetical protein